MKKITKDEAIIKIAQNIIDFKYGFGVKVFTLDNNNFAGSDRYFIIDNEIRFYTNNCNQGNPEESTLKNVIDVLDRCVAADEKIITDVFGTMKIKKLIRDIRNESVLVA